MRLTCTLTGADDTVSPKDLATLSLLYPHVEWALLYSPDREGTARFPTGAWREQFFTEVINTRTAVHLCGQAVRQFEAGELEDVIEPFGRVQLNFNARHYKGDLEKLAAQAARLNKPVIVQHNSANAEVLALFAAPNAQVLYDASGGRGVAPEGWLPPFAQLTGYAGGLKPDNLTAELCRIAAVVGDTRIWVDMETGIRDAEDNFSLEKAVACLGMTVPYA